MGLKVKNNNTQFEFGEYFTIGELKFVNTLDKLDSVLKNVDLELYVDLIHPDLQTLAKFDLNITTTPDDPGNLFLCKLFGTNCPDYNPDTVKIEPNPLLGTTVTATNGHRYKVDLAFERDTLSAPDPLGVKKTKLNAKVTKVPEPSLMLGLLGVVGVASKLKRKQALS